MQARVTVARPRLFEDLPPRSARPFLKWAGGKGHLASQICELLPRSYGTYWEPFLGGGAVFFAVRPSSAVLADANEELMNCYTCVRDSVEDVIDHLGSHINTAAHYYGVRAQDPSTLTQVERAARLIYLNRTCFNGLYRVNRNGQFNVPYGRYERPTLVQHTALRQASEALQATSLTAADFREVLQNPKAGDFVYLDPPYVPVGRYSDFRRYHKESFRLADQLDLALLFTELDGRGCAVALSNSFSREVLELYGAWRVRRIQARRNINSKGKGRGPITEILVTNF